MKSDQDWEGLYLWPDEIEIFERHGVTPWEVARRIYQMNHLDADSATRITK